MMTYLLFLLIGLLILFPLLVFPYHETFTTTGIVTKESKTYFMMVTVPKKYLSDIWDSKIVINRKKYNVHVQKFFYDKTKEQYSFLLEINMEKKIRVENVPIDITFELKETTLLKQIEQKMKGWFS